MKFPSLIVAICLYGSVVYSQTKMPQIGIAQPLDTDSLMKAAGYSCMVESIQSWVSPEKFSDAQFEDVIARFAKAKLPVYALNIFIPGNMKLVGPDVHEQQLLDYAEKVFDRCDRLGVSLIVWGSGGARRVPEGFDHGVATKQFVAIATKISELARKKGIVLALENLNHTETNFINTVADALEVVKKVDQPNFKLCADIYHMLMEDESPGILSKTRKYLIHCDAAEKDGRTPPGVHNDDFRPYLTELYKVGYSGMIILECQWRDLENQASSARVAFQNQLNDVYGR